MSINDWARTVRAYVRRAVRKLLYKDNIIIPSEPVGNTHGYYFRFGFLLLSAIQRPLES